MLQEWFLVMKNLLERFLIHQKEQLKNLAITIKPRLYGHDKIDVADMKNLGIGRAAGTITAAHF